MKKLLLIFGTLAALVGAFVVYFSMQSKFGMSASQGAAPDQFQITSDRNGDLFKPGSGAWSKQYDRDGNLYYQFRCDYYDPQPDGTVKVKHPVIQFFLSGGQVMQIEGKTGSIRFAAGAEKGIVTNSPTEPPRYGNLRDVTVKLFPSVAQVNGGDPDVLMTMANAQFDNDTFRLFTQEFTDDTGKVVHEDDVPVTVSARDYAFTGSGLVLYWNDLDKRLKSLQIAHGQNLTLYDAGDYTVKAVGAQNVASAQEVSAPPVASPRPVADSSTAPSLPAETAPSPRQRYTATFYDRVRVSQGGQEIVDADRMDVDFAAKSQNAGAPANPASNAANPQAPPASESAKNSDHHAEPPASSQRSQQPIVIRWNGPMRMVPTDASSAEPLAEGKAIIRLMGEPVRVHEEAADTHQSTDIQCEQLSYHTGDSSAHLSGHVRLMQTRVGRSISTVTGGDLVFSRADHLATFIGPGTAKMPDPNDRNSVLSAGWADGCKVRFFDLPGNDTQIHEADLNGNVRINHPRFELAASKTVTLAFDQPESSSTQPSGAPPLRKITAQGDAQCTVHEANHVNRMISGQLLTLTRDPGPDGRLYAHRVQCSGDVRAEQTDEELRCRELAIDLLPTTAPSEHSSATPAEKEMDPAKNATPRDDLANSVALDHLSASGDVQIRGKDNSAARATDLDVQMTDNHAHVTLSGSEDAPAMVKDKWSTLTGPVIHFSPHEQVASVDGPGEFNGVQQPSSPGEKPRPMKLTWSQGASIDGAANRGVVHGQVSAETSDGLNDQSASCDQINITLADVPQSIAPATRPAKTETLTETSDFMRNKQVRLVSLRSLSQGGTGKLATVESNAQDRGGNLLHRYDLLSRTIDFDPNAKRVDVNGPGDIVAQEVEPATSESTTQPSAIGGAGNTAIDWQKRFVYDEATHSAAIDGDITIVHQGIGPKSQSVRLDHADAVMADFYPGEPKSNKQAGAVAASTPKLRQLSATGPMVIRTSDKTIQCGEFVFDPADQTLDCTGGQLGKVVVVDDNNLDSGACAEAVFDMKTNELKKLTNVTGHGQ